MTLYAFCCRRYTAKDDIRNGDPAGYTWRTGSHYLYLLFGDLLQVRMPLLLLSRLVTHLSATVCCTYSITVNFILASYVKPSNGQRS